MPINPITKNPERIRSLDEVDSILTNLRIHQRENRMPAGVLLLQNRQLGGVYVIETQDKAEVALSTPILADTPEFGITFYTVAYFEAMRDRLAGKDKVRYYMPFTFSRK